MVWNSNTLNLGDCKCLQGWRWKICTIWRRPIDVKIIMMTMMTTTVMAMVTQNPLLDSFLGIKLPRCWPETLLWRCVRVRYTAPSQSSGAKFGKSGHKIIFTARGTECWTRSCYANVVSVCLSVRPSVHPSSCNVDIPWLYGFGYFEIIIRPIRIISLQSSLFEGPRTRSSLTEKCGGTSPYFAWNRGVVAVFCRMPTISLKRSKTEVAIDH